MEKYGIYSVDGRRLPNSKWLLEDEERFWGSLTERVLDRVPNNMFGILLQPTYIGNDLHWIVREANKWNLEKAVDWCKHMFIKP